jgi:hypothetical protein
MPKIVGRREKRHQPFWDVLIRGSVGNFTIAGGQAALQATNNLFTSATRGNIALTNMTGSGQFPSDQTFRVLALRVGLYFRGSVGTAGGIALTDHVMYHHAITQNFWDLQIEEKSYFQAFTHYMPLGGGLFGDVGSDTTVYFNNGEPSQEALCRLGRSISIPARQSFTVVNTIAALGAFNFINDIAGLTAGEAWIWFVLDGLQVRDIL